jgi:hypothetical protein
VAGIVFALVCLVQILRLATGFEVVIAGRAVPLWPNAIAAIVAGSLSLWMWRLAGKGM